MAVDTRGHLLAAAVGRLAADIQDATGDSVTLAFVGQGYTGETAADAAASEGIARHVVKLPEQSAASSCRLDAGVVERSLAWATRCRRLVKDYDSRRHKLTQWPGWVGSEEASLD
jgi:transposase